jgi:hypothetical protein
MRELHGKGWRVLGYFVWMLGAGVVLDGGGAASGRVLLLGGAAMFAVGVWQSLRGPVRDAE